VRQDLDEAAAGAPDAVSDATAHLETAVDELRRTLAHVHPGAGRGGGSQRALLYSLARELLGNAAKHARAAHVTLTAARAGSHVTLTVSDDGDGFTPDEADAPGHFGLLTVRHRVTAAGGTVTIADGPGTKVVIELPATA
jgi:signal transduction histidine kinase